MSREPDPSRTDPPAPLEPDQKHAGDLRPTRRQGGQHSSAYYVFSQTRRNWPGNEQHQHRVTNGQRFGYGWHPHDGQRDTRPPGYDQLRRLPADPVVREQRRLFYQTHYRNIDNQNNKTRAGYAKQYRGSRSRTAQTCESSAQSDQKGVPFENGLVETGSSARLPGTAATGCLVSQADAADQLRNGQRVSQQQANRPHDQPRRRTNKESGTTREHQSKASDGRHRSTRSSGRGKNKKPGKGSADVQPGAERKETGEKREDDAKKGEKEVVVLHPEDDEAKDCPLCLEPLDPTECNLYPCCFCKFQICLFCLNRLKEEEVSSVQAQSVDRVDSQKRVCGSCPGCRNPYLADSDDESMVIAVRMTKKRTKVTSEKSDKGNRPANAKPEMTATAKDPHDRTPGNRRLSYEVLTQAKRPPHDHHKQLQKEGVNYEREGANDYRSPGNRWKGNGSSESHSRRDERRGPGRGSHGRQTRGQKAGSRDGDGRVLAQKSLPRNAVEPAIASCDPDRSPDQKQDATSIKAESTEEKKQELVSLLSSLGLSPCNIRFHPQRQESCDGRLT